MKKGRKGKRSGLPVNDDLPLRCFTTAGPNRKWVTDLTEHPTAEDKVQCFAMKDLLSNRIVGHAMNDRMSADLAVAALRTALSRREPDGSVIVHAEAESQFRAGSFQEVLKAAAPKARLAVSPPPATTPPCKHFGQSCIATS